MLQCTRNISGEKGLEKGESKHETGGMGCEWWVQVKELNRTDDTYDGTTVNWSSDDATHGHNHSHGHNHGYSHGHSHDHSQGSCCADEQHHRPSQQGADRTQGHSHDHGHGSSGDGKVDLTEENNDKKNKNENKDEKISVSPTACAEEQSRHNVRNSHHLRGQDSHGHDHGHGHCDGYDDDDDECSDINAGGGIGLHYDKDEEVAEHFGVGVFPQISTVTYLSVSPTAAPTVIIENTPDLPVGKEIQKCYISYPLRGKHVRFDGRYLHGACPEFCVNFDDMAGSPDIKSLKFNQLSVGDNENENKTENKNEEKNSKSFEIVKNENSKKYRVTFLANIWYGHKPSKIEILPQPICDTLLKIENELNMKSAAVWAFLNDLKFVSNTEICVINVTKKTVLKEDNGFWQDIPFVTSESDWGKKEDEMDLFLRIWIPSGNYLLENKNKMGIEKPCKKASTKSKGKEKDKGKGKEKVTDKEKDVEERKGKEKELDRVLGSTFEMNYTDEESAASLFYNDDGDDHDHDDDDDDDDSGEGSEEEKEDDEKDEEVEEKEE